MNGMNRPNSARRGMRRGMGDVILDPDETGGFFDDSDGGPLYNGVDLNSVSTYISGAAASDSSGSTIGNITALLAQAGLTAAQVVGVLNQPELQSQLNSSQMAYLQQELALANAQAVQQQSSKNNLLLLAGVALVAVLFISRKDR